ncbi:tetratricopeptide repeat protein [Streptomyces sp. YJ-C3]
MEELHAPSIQNYFRGHAEQDGRVFTLASGIQVNADHLQISDLPQQGPLEGLSSYTPVPVASADPLDFGVYRAEANQDGQLPEYVSRNTDAEIRRRISEVHTNGGFVLISGDSTAGKTRSAFEGLMAECPGSKIWAPTDGPDLVRNLRAAIEQQDDCFIWLDDLERYIGPDGLTPTTLAVMKKFKLRSIATIRAEQYRRLTPMQNTAHRLDDVGRHNALGSRVLDQLHPIVLDRRWHESELARAREVRDSRVTSAVAHSRLFGVAEYMAAGPRLFQEWSLAGGPGGSPRGAALVAAAVDLARAGITSEVPINVLLELHEAYLNKMGGDLLRPEGVQEALEWATLRRYGITSLLLPIRAGSHYRVFDYLPDALARSSEPPEILTEAWQAALEYGDQASLSYHVGMAAVQHRQWGIAEKAWSNDLEKNPIPARINLGRVYLKLDKTVEAKSTWQEAVDLGSIDAAIYLGSQYEREGRIATAVSLFRIGAEKNDAHATYHLAYALPDDKEAIEWWHRIANDTSTDSSGGAAHNLAQAYARQGDKESSSKWWKIGAERGNAYAMNNLGVDLRNKGFRPEALEWFKKAAEAGNSRAFVNWGDLVAKRGDREKAKELIETAITLGDNAAYHRLALLYLDAGENMKADECWRKGYEASDSMCAYNYGVSLKNGGFLEGAKEAFRAAVAGGEVRASLLYAFLLVDDGDIYEAEIQFIKALSVAQPEEICDFGREFLRIGKFGHAMKWLDLALMKGHTHSACPAGTVFLQSGYYEHGEYFLRIALAGGHEHAGRVLSDWLVRTGRGAAAAKVMRSTQTAPKDRKATARKKHPRRKRHRSRRR